MQASLPSHVSATEKNAWIPATRKLVRSISVTVTHWNSDIRISGERLKRVVLFFVNYAVKGIVDGCLERARRELQSDARSVLLSYHGDGGCD